MSIHMVSRGGQDYSPLRPCPSCKSTSESASEQLYYACSNGDLQSSRGQTISQYYSKHWDDGRAWSTPIQDQSLCCCHSSPTHNRFIITNWRTDSHCTHCWQLTWRYTQRPFLIAFSWLCQLCPCLLPHSQYVCLNVIKQGTSACDCHHSSWMTKSITRVMLFC